MFDQPIMTAAKVKDRIAGLLLDIEALKVVEGDSTWLTASTQLAGEILFYVDEHAAAAAAADAALKPRSRPDADVGAHGQAGDRDVPGVW
ncbi:hypothetical protein JQ580_33415 [Bradyrhizobium japonicum]|uniref:hypothetical protein n=1 Tax=Bradyrhizobium japonicum TaxID=375 RepID=UPI001BABF61C|nr:hypothetical protein [Bradyrhizobium japonicum]MBR0995615.1 hypothetical protein [Bradyrhizobium japonicum]